MFVEPLEQQWWIDYRRGDPCARDLLLQKYLPFAKRLSNIFYARRPPGNAEFGDYLHLAYMGLLEAMQRYEHQASATFSTFAAYRIKGAILNGISKMSERGEYISYLRRVQRERTASLMNLNSKGELNFAQAVDLIVNIALTHQLDELVIEAGANENDAADPYASRSYDELKNRLFSAVSQLSKRDQQIIHYHYFNYISFDDISKMLGVSKGRISQLHKRILSDLRLSLREQEIRRCY